MSRLDTTLKIEPLKAGQVSREPLSLSVAFHPDKDNWGKRFLLPKKVPVVLGRTFPLMGEGVLDRPMISRQHVRLRVKGDQLELKDLNSSNGTFVNGELLPEAMVEVGDVIGLGDILLLVTRGRENPKALPDPFVGFSNQLADICEEIEAVADRDTTVLLLGETLNLHSVFGGLIIILGVGLILINKKSST